MNNSDYYSIYKQYHNRDIPKGWEIHHIDYNHNNNNYENLVALPKELHQRLHKAYQTYTVASKDFNLQDVTLHSGRVSGKDLFIDALYEYIQVINECVPYMNQSELEIMNNTKEVFYVY